MDYYKDEEQICDVGDEFYVCDKNGIIRKVVITKAERMSLGHYVYTANGRSYFKRNFGDIIFKDLMECKRVYARKFRIKEKRRILKEYELKLNEELDLPNHYIIK